VGVWHLNEVATDEGTVAGLHRDSTVNALHMNQNGNDDTTGVTGRGQVFDGSNDRVEKTDSTGSPLDVTSAITITAWIRPSVTMAGYKGIVEKKWDTSYCLSYDVGAESLRWDILGSSQAGAASVLTVNQWQQVGAKFDSNNKTDSKIFRNGGVVATLNQSSGSLGPDNNGLAFGGRPSTGESYYFNGAMDEVRISSVARSTNWVWAEYQTMANNTTFNNYGAVTNLPSASRDLPIIANLAAANITTNSSDLVGSLTSTGTSVTAVWVYWGTTDQTTNANLWAYTNSFGNALTNGSFATNTSYGATFTKGTTCYYNFYAQNASGGVWGATAGSASFTTLTDPSVTVSDATVGIGSATLHGTLTSDGGAATDVYFC
jgi:hypothetical protein